MPNAMITSLLDTDFYKLTMMQCVMHQFPNVNVGYRLILRKPVDLLASEYMVEENIEQLCQLQFQSDELAYLESLQFFKSDFLDYLSRFRLPRECIHIEKKNNVVLTIEGAWQDTILFEVPLLALITESYYRVNYPHTNLSIGRERLTQKIDFLKEKAPHLALSEFGTRRRFSHDWQDEVIKTLHTHLPHSLVGTSNVYFAKKYGLKPIGTMAHEYLQASQVLAPHIKGSQAFALNAWLKEYPKGLGIALTDSLTMDVFLSEFDKSLANSFEGLRQDSGDPIEWGEKALRHYHHLGIDPKEKIFVFSDNLNVEKAKRIYDHFHEYCQPVFGIGTNLTNDLGLDSIDVVIKMIHTNHRPVLKITDSPGKTVCDDPAYLDYVKKQFNL